MQYRRAPQNKARKERTHLASNELPVRSGLEKAFADILLENDIPFTYEATILPYTIPVSTHRYVVDWTLKGILIETKGRLTGEDRKKMLLVKEQHPDKLIVFVFSNKNKKLYKNSKTSYAAWCEKHGFNYLDIKEVESNPNKLFTLKPIIKVKDVKKKTVKPKRNGSTD
jgi:hypothetical protein